MHGTQRRTPGKSLKNALNLLRYAKRHLRAEATSNSEKIKPVALAVIELRWSEDIRQLVSQSSQSVSQSVQSVQLVSQSVGNSIK